MPLSLLRDNYMYVQTEGRNLKVLLYFREDLPSCQIKGLFNTSQWANGFEKAPSRHNSAVFIQNLLMNCFSLVDVCGYVCVSGGEGLLLYQRWFKNLALVSSRWVSNRSFAPQIELLFSLTRRSEIGCSNSEMCKPSGW